MKTFLIPDDFSQKNQEHIQILQQALIALGYTINATEVTNKSYGSTAKSAVNSFQADHALASCVNIDTATINKLNGQLNELYRVCGHITNDYNMPIEGVQIQLFIEHFSNRGANPPPIATGVTLQDGSYRLYLSGLDSYLNKNGRLKNKLCLRMEFYQDNLLVLTEHNLLIQERETVFNFSSTAFAYKGDSIYYSLDGIFTQHSVTKASLTAMSQDELIQFSRSSGINIEVLMKVLLSEQLSSASLLPSGNLPPDFFFACLHQGIPHNMPETLFGGEVIGLDDTGWSDYKAKLKERIETGLILMPQQSLHEVILNACKHYYIDPQNEIWIEQKTQLIAGQKDVTCLTKPILEGGASIQDILGATGISTTTLNTTLRTKIARLFCDYLNDFTGFIEALNNADIRTEYGINSISAANIKTITITFEISRLVRNYVPLVSVVRTQHSTNLNSYGVRYLASLQMDTWTGLINSIGALQRIPEDFEEIRDYAEFIYKNAKGLYPDIATLSNIRNSAAKILYSQEIESVLLQNTGKNILTDKFENFSMSNTYKNDPEFQKEFKVVQHIHRITPTPEAAAALLGHHISSAGEVYLMGKERLTATLGDLVSATEINHIFDAATTHVANALIAYTNISYNFFAANPYAVSNYDINQAIENLQGDIPNIDMLFGDPDYCECDSDASIYSPAAYLADLLLFLDQTKNQSGSDSLKSLLDARRADIGKIHLNKQNTSTLMPYIDLVCEVLEEAVIRSTYPAYSRPEESCQSTLPTEELCAAPEHILAHSGTTAYDIIKRCVYPMYAPFNLYQTESRAYLKKMGIDRYDMMEAFQQSATYPPHVTIAAEYFGLTDMEEGIITAGIADMDTRNEAWNPNPVTGTGAVSIGVPAFMESSGLTAHEVIDLTQANWTKLTNLNLEGDCSVKDKHVTGTPLAFDRAHRFIRLWRKSGWKIGELNLLLNSKVTNYAGVNTDNLNASALHNLRLFIQQMKSLKLSCEQLITLYDVINTNDLFEKGKIQPSLYEKVYLNTAVQNPVNSNLKRIKTTPASIVADSDDDLIASCLSIALQDYYVLKSNYNTASKDLAYLSYLYRYAVLSKSLKISVPDLITLLKFREINLTLPFTLSAVETLITTVAQMKKHAFGIAEYEYVADYAYEGAVSEEAEAIALTGDQLKEYTQALKAEADKFSFFRRPKTQDMEIVPGSTPAAYRASDAYREIFLQYLSTIERYKEEKTRNELIELIENRSDMSVRSAQNWVQNNAAGLIGMYSESANAHTRSAFSANSVSSLNAEAAGLVGVNSDGLTGIIFNPALDMIPAYNEKQGLVDQYNRFIDYLMYETEPAIAVRNYIAQTFELSTEITDKYLKYSTEQEESLLDRLLDLNHKLDGASASNYAMIAIGGASIPYNIYKTLILIHKVAFLIRKCKMTYKDFVFLFRFQDKFNFNWFSFKTDIGDTPVSFSALYNLTGLMGLQNSYGQTEKEETLFTLLQSVAGKDNNAVPSASFASALCLLAGWKRSDFDAITGANCMNLKNSRLYSFETYRKIQRCMDILSLVQVPAAVIIGSPSAHGWMVRETDDAKEKTQCAAIKNAAKAHYDIDTWLKELPALQKPIREAKANALASYLIHISQREAIEPLQDKTDLYSYFLLDTEMSAEMKTSRMVQATSSLQLFVQRCSLNLEKEVIDQAIIFPEDKWMQWEWMKRYRLWEANQKIFLYPENWIEPELRDDKSPFFRELEDELNQSEITTEHAETVFQNYLEKLDDVANLTVCGIYREQEGTDVDILHVVARTRSAPYRFYYRRYDHHTNTWSYWEQIDLDIKGETVVPMVYNRKLHLFWIATTQKTYTNNKKKEDGKELEEQYKYTEIQLEWSVFKKGKWNNVSRSLKKHVQYGHRPVLDYSLIGWYDDELNEIIFSVYSYFYKNKDDVNHYHSCNLLSGIFYFNGEVYQTASNISHSFDIEFDDETNKRLMEQLEGAFGGLLNKELFRLGIPYLAQIAENPKDSFLNPSEEILTFEEFLDETGFEIITLSDQIWSGFIYLVYVAIIKNRWENINDKIDLFNKITSSLDENTKPLTVFLPNSYGSAYPSRAFLRSSRLYPMQQDKNKDKWEICLHNYNWYENHKKEGASVRLISSESKDANVILMMHDYDSMWSGFSRSHEEAPLFYQDHKRIFFILPEYKDKKIINYEFVPFYHPYSNLFLKELHRGGIPQLFGKDLQHLRGNYANVGSFDFYKEYNPVVNGQYLNVSLSEHYRNNKNKEIIDFSGSGAYSLYNWELFFHAPLYIACKLSQNQKYEEAMRWFHYIFNPTDKSADETPAKFWITRPFFEETPQENWEEGIVEILNLIKEKANIVTQWLKDPFNPHLVARSRISAFQKTVVMKYIDNLIAWADQLFGQDTMESNNEASLLYVLAYEILGKRPVALPENDLNPPQPVSYNDMADSNALYQFLEKYDEAISYGYTPVQHITGIGNPELAQSASLMLATNYDTHPMLAALSGTTDDGGAGKVMGGDLDIQAAPVLTAATPSSLFMSYENSVSVVVQNHYSSMSCYPGSHAPALPSFNGASFCVPYNDKLLGYWDVVEDRLFKLRNCMNIKGIVRQLPLFAPPIDPAMLVRAAASGLSLADALSDLNAPQPFYRFRTMLQKAIEFTGEVKQLGDKLLAALEKKDAETLSLLRSSQEITTQQALKQIRNLQIDEAKGNIESLHESIYMAEARKAYYAEKNLMNSQETKAYALSQQSLNLDRGVSVAHKVCAILALIPDSSVGIAGAASSPLVEVAFGSTQLVAAANAITAAMAADAALKSKEASHLLTYAGYERRKEDWDFQAQMADMEIVQLNKQLTAAEIRLMMAEKELENLEMQIEQSQSVKEYYKDKYTNEELYNWMITQISNVYFQAYKLACDMAKKAEKCYHHEFGLSGDDAVSIIRYGHWDSLRKGLLSGDTLMCDLHRLDAAYIDGNKRSLELTKHISLAQMFPDKLMELISGKSTELNLEEFLFDMDYPGHYMRRIKSVSVTIPNVAGPYSTISFMLTLKEDKIRKRPECGDPNQPDSGYTEEPLGGDPRFVYHAGGGDSICTSSAQNDAGLFELNFGDERYLPFEYAGVISKWMLSLPAGCDQFDRSSISDVILHINYTAEQSGTLAIKAKAALQEALPRAGHLLFSLKQGFPDAWSQMESAGANSMSFEIGTEQLPYFLRGREELSAATVAAVLVSNQSGLPAPAITLAQGTSQEKNIGLTRQEGLSDPVFYCGSATLNMPARATWRVGLTNVPLSDIEDLFIAFKLS